MDIAANCNAIVDGTLDSSQRTLDILNTTFVVFARDAVLGHDDRNSGFFRGETNSVLQRFGIELVSHLSQLSALGWRKRFRPSDSRSGIRLDSNEVVLFRQLQPRTVNMCLLLRVTAVCTAKLIVLHRQGQTDGNIFDRFDGCLTLAV